MIRSWDFNCKDFVRCNAFYKRKSFKFISKTGTEELFLILNGSAFQSEGDAMEKDLAP